MFGLLLLSLGRLFLFVTNFIFGSFYIQYYLFHLCHLSLILAHFHLGITIEFVIIDCADSNPSQCYDLNFYHLLGNITASYFGRDQYAMS